MSNNSEPLAVTSGTDTRVSGVENYKGMLVRAELYEDRVFFKISQKGMFSGRKDITIPMAKLHGIDTGSLWKYTFRTNNRQVTVRITKGDFIEKARAALEAYDSESGGDLSPPEKLEKYEQLRQDGVISDEEFEAKKDDILGDR